MLGAFFPECFSLQLPSRSSPFWTWYLNSQLFPPCWFGVVLCPMIYANWQKDIYTHKLILSLDKTSDQAKGLVWLAWPWEGWGQWLYFSVAEALWGCFNSHSSSFLLCMLYTIFISRFSQQLPVVAGQVWKVFLFIYKITNNISKTLKETATNSIFIDPV